MKCKWAALNVVRWPASGDRKVPYKVLIMNEKDKIFIMFPKDIDDTKILGNLFEAKNWIKLREETIEKFKKIKIFSEEEFIKYVEARIKEIFNDFLILKE
jgi:predicted metal-dependent hydrolase